MKSFNEFIYEQFNVDLDDLTEQQLDYLINILQEKKAKIKSRYTNSDGILVTVYEPEEPTKKQLDMAKGGHAYWRSQVLKRLAGQKLPSSKGGDLKSGKESKDS